MFYPLVILVRLAAKEPDKGIFVFRPLNIYFIITCFWCFCCLLAVRLS